MAEATIEQHNGLTPQTSLREGSAGVQYPIKATKYFPLHAAVAACGKPEAGKEVGEEAFRTIKYLLENGAKWNGLNDHDETPGCIALKLGQTRIYEVMVEEVVRDKLRPSEAQAPDDVWGDNRAYLKSQIRYKSGTLIDRNDNAVMMDWETQLQNQHAESLLPKPGLKVMNIGFGMGIVDTVIQTHKPSEHHIVEAHPSSSTNATVGLV